MNTLPTDAWFMNETARAFLAETEGHALRLRKRRLGSAVRRIHVDIPADWMATLDVDEIRERYVRPMAKVLAAQVKEHGLHVLKRFTPANVRAWRYSIVRSESLGVCLVGSVRCPSVVVAAPEVFRVELVGRPA